MNYLDAILLGIVEGVAEFLPISSTGHLILVSYLLKIPDSEFLKSFEIAIQLGAIFAVVFLYYKKFYNVRLLKKLLTAFLPTAILGLIFYSFIKSVLLGSETIVLLSLLIGGLLLIIFELFHKEKDTAEANVENITYKHAFIIGLFQSIAMIPGVSRSAATIIGGLLVGLKRVTIVEFSFLLAVPTMGAATGLDLIKSYASFNSGDAGLLFIGFLTAFVVAFFAIKFLIHFIKNNSFIVFGIYRIIVAVLFWLIIL